MKARVYGMDWCGYCARAKKLLTSNGIEFEEFGVDEDVSFEEVSELVGKQVATVPQIFLDDEYIGGYSELVARLREEQR